MERLCPPVSKESLSSAPSVKHNSVVESKFESPATPAGGGVIHLQTPVEFLPAYEGFLVVVTKELPTPILRNGNSHSAKLAGIFVARDRSSLLGGIDSESDGVQKTCPPLRCRAEQRRTRVCPFP
eukprot:3543713-Rhodomonas_salina.1